MHLLLSLPNELLHSVIEYIAYTPRPPSSRSKSPFKCASPELLALSAVNSRLRRVCLPFVFANVRIRDDMDVQQPENTVLALFAKFTRVLVIPTLSQAGDQIISQILPQLEQLFDVELRDCRDRTELLRTILEHPTVTSVLVDRLPHESMCIYDLSKVVLGHKKLLRTLSPELEKFLDRGMRIISLHLYKLDPELISQLDSKVISGLREIRIFSKTVPPSLPWLPVLSSTHPSLNELGFLGGYEQWLNYEGTAPLFLTPLIKESQRQAIDRLFSIRKVDLRRLTVGQPSQEWHVTGLTLKTARASTSLLEILMLVASSFTQLEVLSLDLILHDGIYDIDELTSTFANFSSLRIVYFRQVFRRLNFGPEIETLMPPVEGVDTMHAIDKERASVKGRLLFFISCLAKQVRSLDSIHISDYEGDVYDCSDNCIVSWYFEGWLHVLNGKRDVGGRLEN